MEVAGINLFYIVPFLVFGPIVFLVLFKAIGIQTLFTLSDEQKELQRKHRQLKQALDDEVKKTARFKKFKLTNAKIFGQILLYAPFLLIVGYCSSYPSYEFAPDNMAQIKLSLTLLGERKIPCTTRTAEELKKLAPNMRSAKSCSRERHPVTVSFVLNGKNVFNKSASPAGLRDDGPSSFYQTFMVPAGKHDLDVNIYNANSDTPAQTYSKSIHLSSGQAIALTHTIDEGIVIH